MKFLCALQTAIGSGHRGASHSLTAPGGRRPSKVGKLAQDQRICRTSQCRTSQSTHVPRVGTPCSGGDIRAEEYIQYSTSLEMIPTFAVTTSPWKAPILNSIHLAKNTHLPNLPPNIYPHNSHQLPREEYGPPEDLPSAVRATKTSHPEQMRGGGGLW